MRQQLHMVWPQDKTVSVAEWDLPGGFRIREYVHGDEAAFLALMEAGEFDSWDRVKLHYNISRVIPGGWLFAVEDKASRVVGTVMSLHNYTGSAYFTGDLGWLAVDPSYRGRGLGQALAARATDQLLRAGYARIQLHTEAFRLAAVKVYLRLGFVPVLRTDELSTIWNGVCDRLGWEFTPDLWLASVPWTASPFEPDRHEARSCG